MHTAIGNKVARIEYSPYCSDNGMTAMIVPDNVGVAAVVDKGKRSVRSCADFVLIRGWKYWLKMKHAVGKRLLRLFNKDGTL